MRGIMMRIDTRLIIVVRGGMAESGMVFSEQCNGSHEPNICMACENLSF